MKSDGSFSGPYFPAIGMNTDQNNSKYGHFSRSHKFGEKHNICTKFQDISSTKISEFRILGYIPGHEKPP